MGWVSYLVSSTIRPRVYLSLANWPIADLSFPEKVRSTRSLGGALNPISDSPAPGEDRWVNFLEILPLSRSNNMDCTLVATNL